MTKVHGKRYAYKFDFQGLAASLNPQPEQQSYTFNPDFKHHPMYRHDMPFPPPAGPYSQISHQGPVYPPQKHPYIPSPPTRSPSYGSHGGIGAQYPWHPDLAGYPHVPSLQINQASSSNQPLPPTSFYNWIKCRQSVQWLYNEQNKSLTVCFDDLEKLATDWSFRLVKIFPFGLNKNISVKFDIFGKLCRNKDFLEI